MLKAFVISDLHGSFPDGIREAVLREEPDVVLCCGDITPFRLRDAFFEHVYGTRKDDDHDKRLWDYIGKARYKAAVKKDVSDAHSVLASLDDLPFPVLFVPGNGDRAVWRREIREGNNYAESDWDWDWLEQSVMHEMTKDLLGVKDISYGADIIGDYVFIGYPTSSFPGEVQSDVYRRHRQWLDNAFRTFEWKKHEDKEVIFVCHNGPYDTETDMIKADDADERAKGHHYGSKLARRIVERYQPRVCVHGHIDEGRGKDSIGNTEIVNVGPGSEGCYGVITLDTGVDVNFLSRTR